MLTSANQIYPAGDELLTHLPGNEGRAIDCPLFFSTISLEPFAVAIQNFAGTVINIYSRYRPIQNFRNIRDQVRSEIDIEDTRENKIKMSYGMDIKKSP